MCSKLGDKVSPTNPKTWGTRPHSYKTHMLSSLAQEKADGSQQSRASGSPEKRRTPTNSQRRFHSHLREWLMLAGFTKALLQDNYTVRRNCWEKNPVWAGRGNRNERKSPDEYHGNNRRGSARFIKLKKIPKTTIATPKILENSFLLNISIRKISELKPTQSY